MSIRPSLALIALASSLAACGTMPAFKLAPTPAPVAELNAPPTPDAAIGKAIEDVVAVNGQPSRQWDMPDGRRAFQWEQSSVTSRVGVAGRGEVSGHGSETTCYYTLYSRLLNKGRWTVVGADPPRPGCLKVAMAGAAQPTSSK